MALFSTSGQVSAFLEVYWEAEATFLGVGYSDGETYPIADVVLLDFNSPGGVGAVLAPPMTHDLAHMDGDTLYLHMGPLAVLGYEEPIRWPPFPWINPGIVRGEMAEVFTISPGANSGEVIVSVDGRHQSFSNVHSIVASGAGGDDTIHVLPGVTADAILNGDDGNDSLLYEGSGTATLYGGVGRDELRGGSGNDHLEGGDGSDFLQGGDGNDFLDGGNDKDRIEGGTGNDTLIGGDGNDNLSGNDGADVLDGGEGRDQLRGGDGDDYLDGGIGDDRLSGQAGNDTLLGSSGNDSLRGDEGDDRLEGGDGRDILSGDVGQDILFGGDDEDVIDGGEGDDTVYGGGGQDILYGSEGADRIEGGTEDDLIDGGAGNDVLFGESGNDKLAGGDGNDTIDGGAGNDEIEGGIGNDLLDGNSGLDILRGDGGNDTLRGGADNDELDGGTGDDTLEGGDGNDVLLGLAGNDSLSGGAGNDTLDGGTGNDILHGDAGTDTLRGYTGNDQLYGGSDDDRLFGGSGDDQLFGESGDDALFGEIGRDTLEGGDNDDILDGGDDDDLLRGGAGADILQGGLGNDTLLGGTGNDQLLGGAGNDDLQGDDGNDVLQGEAGTDTLRGGAGNDFLDGGINNDLLYGDSGADQIYGGDGDDTGSGGTGNDQLFGGRGRDTLSGDEDNDWIEGNEDDDVLLGQAGNDSLFGGAGRDLLFGAAGSDQADGGDENDVIYGGLGDDNLAGGAGQDVVYGEDGNDRLTGGTESDRLYGGDGADDLAGGSGDDQLFGEAGIDTLAGDEGNDYLDGGVGADYIDGGSGDDVLFANSGIGDVLLGGDGNDRIHGSDDGDEDNDFTDAIRHGDFIDGGDGDDVIYGLGGADEILGGAGNDLIDGGGNADLIRGGTGQDEIYAGSGNGNLLFGDAGDDRIYGSQYGADQIHGGDGDDEIHGQAGDDTIYGDSGDDTLDGGPGSNAIYGGDGDDVLEGSDDAADLLDGGAGRDRIYGNAGNDSIVGGDGDDILDGGAGDDSLSGGAGLDVLIGGAGHDHLYGHSQSAIGDDNSLDYLYGDLATNASEPDSGNDRLFGNGGNDLLFGEGGDDYLDGGPGTSNSIDYGTGESAVPSDFVVPSPTLNPVPNPGTGIVRASATLPATGDERIRWSQLGATASGAGLSGDAALSIEPAVATAPGGLIYSVWSDNRNGNFEIYLTQHQNGVWSELSGSAHGGGLSNTATSSRRPSITVDGLGQPVVAWTEVTPSGNRIRVAHYDSTTSTWIALGNSLGSQGISGAGTADQAHIVMTNAGPVVAWIDSSGNIPFLVAKRFSAGVWSDVAPGLASVSSGAIELALATDGVNASVAWTTVVAGVKQIFLREFQGANWIELAGSSSGSGISHTLGDSQAPSLAYSGGKLFAAWQTFSDLHWEVYSAQFANGTWSAAGSGATAAGGVSSSKGQASLPQLSAGGGKLQLLWRDDLLQNNTGSRVAIYSKHWNGNAFVSELPGDADHAGISLSGGIVNALALAVNAIGQPVVAWEDASSGNPEVYLRVNNSAVSNIYYVNDASIVGDSITSAAGSAGNTGSSPASPLASIQQVLNAFNLGPGDFILVDAGNYSSTLVVSADDAGVTILGPATGKAVLNGQVSVAADDVTLQRFQVAQGISAQGIARLNLYGSTVQGAGLTLNNTTATHVLDSSFNQAGIVLSGLTSTELLIANNTFTIGTYGIGVSVTVPSSGNIRSNQVTGGTGLSLTAEFTGSIEHNIFQGGSVGVRYAAPANLADNLVTGNAIGIKVSVNTLTGGLGFVGTQGSNVISNNQVGVELTGRMQGQQIRDNVTGVVGSGILGGEDLAHANLISNNSTGVRFDGTIQFNRIAANEIGIDARSGQLLHHNLIYRNNQTGIEINGQTRVQVVGNTLYSPVGDLLTVIGGSSEVEVRNNLFWAESGYDLYVGNDSQLGFFSDFNTLHSTHQGKLVFWSKQFNDIVDWQADVAQFDLHSSGRTVVNPTWSQPRFAHKAFDDYNVLDTAAGLRFTSPSIDAGDATVDLAVPNSLTNLLVNPSFESGATGWSLNDGGLLKGSLPAPFAGAAYFYPNSAIVGSAVQTIDLQVSGFSAVELDSGDLVVVFGTRVRTAKEAINDRATVSVAFLNAQGQVLSESTQDASSVADRWELVGGRAAMPSGTRQVRFEFTATRRSGNTTDAYMDGAFLRVLSERYAPDQGAFGHSSPDQLQAFGPHIALRAPELYLDWERGRPLPIRWETYSNSDESPVRIDLYQDTSDGPRWLLTIAASVSDTGEFIWTPANDSIEFGTYGLRIQVSLVQNRTVVDRSTETFKVPENTPTFYVNDRSTLNDEFTQAQGDNRNTGKVPNAPKPYPNNVLRTYTLGPGQTLFVDSGNYSLLSPVSVSNIIEFGDDEGFTITGPTSVSRSATLWLANPLVVAPILDLNDADFMTVRHLTFINGQFGLWAHDGSTNFTGSHLTATGHTLDGFRIESGSTVLALDRLTASNNQRHGVYVDGPVATLSASIAHTNGSHGVMLVNAGAPLITHNATYNNIQAGLSVQAAGAFRIQSNESYFNRIGIVALNSGAPAIVGNSDLSLNLGNVVHDNSETGISATGSIIVIGNAVYRQLGTNSAGIAIASGAEAAQNLVYANYNGIVGSGLIRENRIYSNTNSGARIAGGAARGNVVYSNATGIEVLAANSSLVNNLIYSNLVSGVRIAGASDVQIVNNTIFETRGDAVRAENSAKNISLSNNILMVDSGYGINVSANSQSGFQSDYNLLHATGTGKIGFWQSLGRQTLFDWRSATFTDSNSVSQVPLFVDANGADDLLGFQNVNSDGRDDDFHLQSLFGSYHGGGLAPVRSATSGLPEWQLPSLILDASHSIGIDRGSASQTFANEPSPNGGFVNIGAYGNTAQASLSPTEYLTMFRPNGGEVGIAEQPFPIRWRSHDMNGTVRIELLREGNSAPLLTIADDTPNDGEFIWLVPTSIGFGNDFRIKVTRVDGTSGESASTFSLTGAVSAYYVNDGSVASGDWTTAPGNDANDGLSPATPKASIRAILEAYDLGASDRIRIDSGVYSLSANIIVTDNDSGVVFEGYHESAYPDRVALLNRGSTLSGSYAFEIAGADDLTFEFLAITGANVGVLVGNGSNRVVVTANRLFGNLTGVQAASGSSAAVIANNTIFNNAQHGVYLADSPGAVVAENDVYGNGNSGIYASGNFPLAAERIVIHGNTVHDNLYHGIDASYQVLVSGNTVYGHTSSGRAGIYLYLKAEADANVVYGNVYGIYANDRTLSRHNRAFANTLAGIYAYSRATIDGNIVYSNPIGIEFYTNYYDGTQLINNLVYANTNQGIRLRGDFYPNEPVMVTNNTVYQPTGEAIRIEGSLEQAVLRNNILWVEAGYAISVADDSQVGFSSDYNTLYTTGDGKLARWQGRDFTNLADWFYELGFDQHSQTTAPNLLAPNGLDGVLGYSEMPISSGTVIDDQSPNFSTTGTWSSVVGFDGDFLETNGGNAQYTFQFMGLTPNQLYSRTAVASWPSHPGLTTSGNLSVSGSQASGSVAVNQAASSSASLSFTFHADAQGTASVQVSLSGYIADRVEIHDGSIVVAAIDDGDSGFTTSGTWTNLSVNRDYHLSKSTSPAIATWQLTALTPGEFYRLGVSWNARQYLSTQARYEVYDGDKLLKVLSWNQTIAPAGFSDAGRDWSRLGVFQATGTELSIRLVNAGANQAMAADAVIVQHVPADRGLDDDFNVPAGSSTIDAGDPNPGFLNEPGPNGGRVNQGHTGNTAQATTSPALLVQVLSPNNLGKLTVGSQIPITWSSAGINQPGGSYSAGILADSPRGYWRLGESNGTTATDSSGNSHNGTYLNGVGLGETGAIDNDTNTAARFDGSNDSVSIPDSADLRPAQLSVEAWIKPDATASYYGNVLTKASGSNGYGLEQYGGPGKIRFYVNGYSNAYVEATIPVGQWSQVVGTYDGQFVRLYVNGKLSGSLAYSQAIDHSNQPLQIGGTPNSGQSWKGGIDEVAVYDRALTANQVQEHYTHPIYESVDIELLQGSNPTPVATIAQATRNDGQFTWTVPNLIGSDYRLRVRANVLTSPQDTSDGTFLITNAGHDYYVNDGSSQGDEFTTAAGNNANSGKSPDQPMASLTALLNAYDLEPGDIVHVDAGVYQLLNNLKLLPDDSGVRIEGPLEATALFNRGNTATGSYVIEFAGASDATVARLSLTGGQYGVYADNLSRNLTLESNEIFGNVQHGVNLANSAGAVVTENDVYGNGNSGIYASEYVYGNLTAERIVIRGNTVHDNLYHGIDASYQVLVIGNTVYGHTSSGRAGIYLYGGAEAAENVVYGNAYGIYANDSTISRQNRAFANTLAGIYAYSRATIDGNIVYSNPIGIDVNINRFGIQLVNNLVYANTNQGIRLRGDFYPNEPVMVTNNTVYQPTGEAIRIEGSLEQAVLRNNILWVEAGYAISVADDSQVGFSSDYNTLYTTGDGKLARWQGRDFTNLADWFYELGFDQHSQTTPPNLLAPSGPDGVLGYSEVPISSGTVIDDQSPNFSTTGTWSSVVGSGGDFLETNNGGNASYIFPFTGLTPNQLYSRTAVASWPSHPGLTTSGNLSVSGSSASGSVAVNQAASSSASLSFTFRADAQGTASVQVSLYGYIADRVEIHDGSTVVAAIDDGDSGFTTSGTWTNLSVNRDYHLSKSTSPAIATWQLTALTPGEFYRLGVSWNARQYLSTQARYEVYDGNTLLKVLSWNQTMAPAGFSDAGRDWSRLGVFQATGTELSIRLVNAGANQAMAADAVIVQHVPADRGLDDDFNVPAGSSTIDAGDPNPGFLNEPGPNGGRVNQGHTGNTAQATTSPALLVQVLSLNNLEKPTVGSQIPITWSSAGINQPGGSYSAGVLADSPRGYWRLGESSGTTAVDASGNSHNGTYLNGVTLGETGAIDNDTNTAARFDGLNDSVSIPDSADLRPTQLSVEAWIKPDATASYYGNVLTKASGSNGYGLEQYGGPGKIRFYVNGYSNAYVEATIPVGQWSQVVGTYDGQFVRLYVNGKLSGSLAYSQAIDHSNQPLQIGGTPNSGQSWKGGIDEVAVYDRALTANQVQEHYTHLIYESVDIELLQGSNPTPVATIAQATRNDGQFTWTVPNLIGSDYRLRVRANVLTSPQDTSDGTFLITNAGHDYYVNDGSSQGDEFTTAAGSNANSGKSPDQPMASLTALLNAYDLEPGDIVHVDAGVYQLLNNLKLLPDDSGVRIEGPLEATALFNRGNTATGSYVIEFAGAADVSVARLSLTGGQYGVYADNLSRNLTLEGNTIFNNAQHGVYLADSPGAVVAENDVYGNAYSGIYASEYVYGNLTAERIVIHGNTVHDNLYHGIDASYQVLVTGNTVYGHTSSGRAGIYLYGGAEAAENVVYGNAYGIYANDSTISRQNRAFANTLAGIYAYSRATIDGNIVYSNPIGIDVNINRFGIQLVNNLVYANTNQGIRLRGDFYPNEPVMVTNNTVYQPTGEAIRIEGSLEQAVLRNNILWVEAGYAISVANDSQVDFSSDYNILFGGASGSTGYWNGIGRLTLADWQAALQANASLTDRDGHSLQGDPLFADINGADNILGYTSSGGGIDGGHDDNFYRIKRSIAIDSGDTWAAPARDIDGFTRRDDPGTLNTGSPDYESSSLGSSQFSLNGTARGWRSDNTSYTLSLPFSFPFYGTSYTSVSVSTEGFLQFAGSMSSSNSANTSELLRNNRMIAPLWDNLQTYGTGDDIFVDTVTAGQVTIRWNATNSIDNSDVNFSVTLFSDGRVRFDYGSGNTNLTPTVGISRGDGQSFIQPDYDGRTALTGVDSLEFSLTQGKSFVDIGAFEFRGSSLDETPPTVALITPDFIANASDTGDIFDSICVTFSEDVNPIDAQAVANYELRHAGVDGIFDNSDDIVFALHAVYDATTYATELGISLSSGRISAGRYRFTVFDQVGHSVHDLAGLRLDGDDDPATPFSSYIREFSLGNLSPSLEPIENQSVAEGSALIVNTIARDNDVGDVLTYSFAAPVPSGMTIDANTGVINWTPTESQGPGIFLVQVRATDNGAPSKSDAKSFTVVVHEVNRAPALTPIGNRSINELELLQFQAIATDSDLPANTLMFSLIGAPNGALIDSSSGLFSWTPTESQGPGAFTFTVRVSDNGAPGLFVQEQITVTVNEINAAPTLDRILNKSVREGEPVAFTVHAGDTDIPFHTLIYSLDQGAPTGATVDPSTGVFRWAPGVAGVYPITVRATDNGSPSLSAAQNFTIQVFGINSAPLLSVPSSFEGDEQTLLSLAATATDTNTADTLTFTLLNAPAGSTIDATTGLFRWTPTEAQGFGSYTFQIRVTDNGSPSLYREQAVTVTVREVNQSPTLEPIGNKVFNEGSTRTFTVAGKDLDRPHNTLSYSLIGAPAGATIDPITGLFSWTPTETQGPASYSVTVRVTDDGSPALVADEVITLTVNEINEAPSIEAIDAKVIDEHQTLTFQVIATDGDLPSQTLAYSLIGAPLGATIDLQTGVFNWTPGESQGPQIYTFLVRATDDGLVNLFNERQIVITVNEVNAAPVLNLIGNHTVDEGSPLIFTASAMDSDLPAQTLRYLLIGAPLGAQIDSITGVFQWTPTLAQGPGFYTFRVQVFDDGSPNRMDEEEITVTVNHVNQPPTLTVLTPQVLGGVLQELSNHGTWSDLDSANISLTASLGQIAKNNDGTWSWAFTASTPLTAEIVTITAHDGLDSSTVSFTITAVVNVANTKVYYKNSAYSAGGTNVADALDPSKILAHAGLDPLTLSYANLINTTRGINGIVIDIAGMPASSLTTDDFRFRMSPQGLFNEAANPPSVWGQAPAPSGIFVAPSTSTSPARIRVEWLDNTIANRWLQISVIANDHTGLPATEVFYLGHLQGELNGQLTAGAYFVTNADLTMVLPIAGGAMPITNIRDVDKNRFILNSDGVAIRDSVIAGLALRNIMIPASGSASEGSSSFKANKVGNSIATKIAPASLVDLQKQGSKGSTEQHATAPLELSLTVRGVTTANKAMNSPTTEVPPALNPRKISRTRTMSPIDEFFQELGDEKLSSFHYLTITND